MALHVTLYDERSSSRKRVLEPLIQSLQCDLPVATLTHSFYRYPARFSPQFVRAAIQSLTDPGDTVLDPFMGGGTTVVEALALGRRCIGADLSPLAKFLATVKTSAISKRDAFDVLSWTDFLIRSANLRKHRSCQDDWDPYKRHIPWWIRSILESALTSLSHLRSRRQRDFVRACLLRTAQWALDSRVNIPTKSEFLAELDKNTWRMIEESLNYRGQLRDTRKLLPSAIHLHRRLLLRPAAGIDRDRRIPQEWLPPRLVLTSPPYFGIHILYHRWQVRGRRETSAPYWLAGCTDGHYGAYYTFGARSRNVSDVYLPSLRRSFESIAALLGSESIVVQLVGFSDQKRQLPAYKRVMGDVGLEEVDLASLTGRNVTWRAVPNRKWYTDIRRDAGPTKEILLIHRKK